MSGFTKQKQQLAEIIESALQVLIDQKQLELDSMPEINLEVPREKAHGDFASNVALVLAKPAKKNPRQLAELIVASLPEHPVIDKVEIAGPGFINFYLTNQWLYDVLLTIEQEQLAYGANSFGNGERVLLEFVSANPVGPMNVVNARAAAIGDTLAKLLAAAGYSVATEYYVNDAGVQTEVFGRSLEARLQQLANPDYPFPEDGYPGAYVSELAERLKAEKPELLNQDYAERVEFCRIWGIDQMVEWQKQDLADFGVTFDRWFRERDLHEAGALEDIIERLTDRGYMYEKDGAFWFRSTVFGDDKDRVIIKQDGTYTYVTADIAYHYDKLKRGFTKLIDLFGPDHHGYIARMKAAVQALGYPEDALEIMILQYVALLRDGEQVKMSKRAGEFITLQDLMEEVGRDAARYFFLMRSPDSHLDFDLTLAAEQSNENPVYYIQYAHARICSILQQAKEQGVTLKQAKEVSLDLLVQEQELDLIKKMAELPEELLMAATQREPHRMARYALDLASQFHSFYTHCHVLSEADELRDARLVLTNCVKIVLQRTLGLLGISAPERM